jgi:hypothetical protein
MDKKGYGDIKTYRLVEEIMERSESSTWEEAQKEWTLDSIKIADDKEVAEGSYTCLCGHRHLKELCYIINKYNGTEALVGNCCIKKFMHDIKSDKIFRAINAAKRSKTISAALIDYCHEHDIINTWEHDFFMDVHRKRKMTDRQSYKFEMVRSKILDAADKL